MTVRLDGSSTTGEPWAGDERSQRGGGRVTEEKDDQQSSHVEEEDSLRGSHVEEDDHPLTKRRLGGTRVHI
jgi:hypothetical protein